MSRPSAQPTCESFAGRKGCAAPRNPWGHCHSLGAGHAPSQGFETSPGLRGDLGSSTVSSPGASALPGGPCRSPVAQLPLPLSVPVLLLPLCILQAHSDVR